MRQILVIEDDVLIRENLTYLLEAEGFAVRRAENGAVALELLRSYKPDLIICDLMMPELNGFEILAILQQTSTGTIPFIFLTAVAALEDLQIGMNLGADGYITKPFRRRELLTTIKRFC